MLLLFALPAFVAYGVVHATGPAFYIATALVLPPFVLIPAALGVMTTTVLVNVFPARRTKDILVLLSVVAVAMLYLLFRLVRPERLVNPDGFADFGAFLAAMRTPDASFLPSTWATEILFPLLGLRDGNPLFYYGLLLTTAAVAVMACEAIVARLFVHGWTKAQEGRQARFTQRALWERVIGALTSVFPLQTRILVIKEVKTFFRDTSQWSQLILLGALVVVYLYNFSVLPLQGSPLVTFYFKNVIAFLNLALASFVIASVAARFVFPSFSMEGRALWLLKGAPLPARHSGRNSGRSAAPALRPSAGAGDELLPAGHAVHDVAVGGDARGTGVRDRRARARGRRRLPAARRRQRRPRRRRRRRSRLHGALHVVHRHRRDARGLAGVRALLGALPRRDGLAGDLGLDRRFVHRRRRPHGHGRRAVGAKRHQAPRGDRAVVCVWRMAYGRTNSGHTP
jgi:hypothetical protein